MRDPDVIVVGSGPNGLVAANIMSRRGFRVLVLEANPRRPGGALGSEELTLPGFVHDVGAAFFPFAKSSPAFRELDLSRAGVKWLHLPFESCHPALDGSYACIARDAQLAAAHFGSPRDGQAWQKLAASHARMEPALLQLLLGPFPALAPALKLGLGNLSKILWRFARSGGNLSRSLFRSEAARRVLPSFGLHVDVGPEDWFGSAMGYLVGMTAATGGYAVPAGGAQTITNALVTLLESYGGRLRLAARVTKIIVADGRAAAVRLENGEELRARLGVIADTAAPTLYLKLLERAHVPNWLIRRMRQFRQGFATFKVDFALSSAVPWSNEQARQSSVVQVSESLADLSRFTRELRMGKIPELPYLVVGQQSLADPFRAPSAQHTLYCYTHVPPLTEGGWTNQSEAFADRISERLEGLAPGFSALVLGRHVSAPPDLEAANANLIDGDLGGGGNAWHQQLLFRPVFPYFRYRTPIAGLYLCSSYTHPGAGVHGMCGYNAAQAAAHDLS
ncbi:MAG TPA: NAD(P)/FAD-dependent oxidoreductase [Polyangiaceae bacterium]|nr:NAD(P)/FAD-dependent oxidoreductase [Polyangiaceae bacterium]